MSFLGHKVRLQLTAITMDLALKQELKQISQDLAVTPFSGKRVVKFDFKTYPLVANQALYVISIVNEKMIYHRGIFELLGYSNEEFNFDSPFDLIHKKDFPLVESIIKNTLIFSQADGLPSESVLCITFRMRKKNGTYIRVQSVSGICQNYESESFVQNYCILQDISYMGMHLDVQWDWTSPGLNKDAYLKAIQVQPMEILTKRENQVVELILEGHDGYSISERLGISYNTVKTHRKNIFQKTQCKSVPELMNFIRKGLFRSNK